VMSTLTAMLVLAACSEATDQGTTETSTSMEPGSEEVKLEAKEENEEEEEEEEEVVAKEESTPSTDEEPKTDEVHETVDDVISSGHEAMIKDNNLRGWEDEEAVESLVAVMDELIPATEEAIHHAEDEALKEDLKHIHSVSTNFIEKIENNMLSETEWRSRTSELRNAFMDLDYYVRGEDEYDPYHVTHFAAKQLDEAMLEDPVREQFEKLPKETQEFIVYGPIWHKEAFVNNHDFRKAVVEAYEIKGKLDREDIDFIFERMVDGEATKDETVQQFTEERM